MGLFTQLLLLPVAPVRGVMWLAEQLEKQAELELYGPDAIQRRLDEIERMYEHGEISAQDRDMLEEDVMDRLRQGDPGER